MHRNPTPRLRRKGAACGCSRWRHPAYAAHARLEKVPRKTPEKPVDKPGASKRNCWSAECADAEEREEPRNLVAGVKCNCETLDLQIPRSGW